MAVLLLGAAWLASAQNPLQARELLKPTPGLEDLYHRVHTPGPAQSEDAGTITERPSAPISLSEEERQEMLAVYRNGAPTVSGVEGELLDRVESALDGPQAAAGTVGTITVAPGSEAESVGTITAAPGSEAESVGTITATPGPGAESVGTITAAPGPGTESVGTITPGPTPEELRTLALDLETQITRAKERKAYEQETLEQLALELSGNKTPEIRQEPRSEILALYPGSAPGSIRWDGASGEPAILTGGQELQLLLQENRRTKKRSIHRNTGPIRWATQQSSTASPIAESYHSLRNGYIGHRGELRLHNLLPPRSHHDDTTSGLDPPQTSSNTDRNPESTGPDLYPFHRNFSISISINITTIAPTIRIRNRAFASSYELNRTLRPHAGETTALIKRKPFPVVPTGIERGTHNQISTGRERRFLPDIKHKV
jgi:hypothetical protein